MILILLISSFIIHIILIPYVILQIQRFEGSKEGVDVTDKGFIVAFLSSLINHSCAANMLSLFAPEGHIFFATNPIKKGEEVNDCFVLHEVLQFKIRVLYYYHCRLFHNLRSCLRNGRPSEGGIGAV